MRRRLLPLLALLPLALIAFVVLRPTTPKPALEQAEEEGEAERGAELIRHYFEEWHDPYPAELGRELQDAIWREVRAVPAERTDRDDPAWVCAGPFGMFGPNAARYTGRVLDIDVNATGLRRVAAASGGVWQLDGSIWTPLTDALDTQWIGSLDTSPLDPDLILVGTGEPHIRAGTGLWRSTDGGATWQNRPMSPPPATCFRLRFLPDGQTVVAAFDLGIYRSTNAGQTWTRTALPHWPTDLAIHPSNPLVMWTPVQEHGLFRSTNGGVSWSQVVAPGLPTSGNGRGAITVCDADPNRLYVAYSGLDGHTMGIFRTDDGGASWQDVSPPDDYMWGQGWYNNAIGVSPTDPDLVLAGGGGLLRSTDGGATWVVTATAHVHADVHAVEWTADGANLYVGTDGGYSHSTSGGASYFTSFNRLPITQYVNIDVGNTFPLIMGGGSQDNAISVTTDAMSWFVEWGGDGGGFTIDDHDNTRMWATSGLWGGDILFRCGRSTNGGTTWVDINNGLPPSNHWYTRIRSNQADPPRIYTNTLAQVYASDDAGDLWFALNPTPFPANVRELTVSGDAVFACLDSQTSGLRLRVFENGAWSERSTGLVGGVLVRKVAPDLARPGRCFALMNGMGTPGQKVYVSENNGLTWTNISANLPDVPLSDLVAHPVDPSRLYLSTEFGCYASEDGGASWQRWNLGMPEAAMVTELALADLRDDHGELKIAAGTYGRGIWTRDITGTITGVPGETAVTGVQLDAPYPNPARAETRLSFSLARRSAVRLAVYDLQGRRVREVLNGAMEAGEHAADFDARGLASGVYLARLETEAGTSTQRVTVLR